jgi:hypothetical protein
MKSGGKPPASATEDKKIRLTSARSLTQSGMFQKMKLGHAPQAFKRDL